MISVIVIGTSAYSRLLKKRIEAEYNPYAVSEGAEALFVAAYYDMFSENDTEEDLDGIPVLTKHLMGTVVAEGSIGAIVLPQQPVLDIQYLMYELRQMCIPQEMIYFTSQTLLEEHRDNNSPEQLLVPYEEASYLPYLEFHIEDACNLNCKACEHYSPLVKQSPETKTDYDSFEKDLRKLKEYITDIGRIRVLGGEPLLNPELPKYLVLVREVYPACDLFVVTNGLLLHKITEETMQIMRDTNTSIIISYYPPMEGKLDGAIHRLEECGIKIICSPLLKVFSIKQNLDGNSDAIWQFNNCFQSTCNNIYRGCVAACMLPFMTHYFNDIFGYGIPEDGAINLYEDGLTTTELKRKLAEPFERCRFCSQPVNVPWEQAKKEPTLSDWVLEGKHK